jgi:hypothetical protein
MGMLILYNSLQIEHNLILVKLSPEANYSLGLDWLVIGLINQANKV